MDVFGFLFFAVLLAIEIYQAYGLWRDPKGSWKKYTGRQARIRARTRGTLLEIFDFGQDSFENYVLMNKILNSLFILFTIFLMGVAVFSPK